jgi:DMSO/TMAO reductase YedYZ molybdopterin-dependent catalytic subunit
VRAPWANILLLVILILQTASGYLALTNGQFDERWLVWLHGIGAYALVLLLIWKGQIIVDALRRKRVWTNARRAFLLLLALLILTLGSGIVWTIWGPLYLGGFSVISLHMYLAVPLMALLVWHAWRQRFVLRIPQSRDRRLFVRGLLLAAGGALAWGAVSGLRAARLARRPRRFSGSYETGSFSGQFPTVSWIADRAPAARPEEWRLAVGGLVQEPLVFSYAQLLEMAREEETAVLDCTGGWYSEQVWGGVRVGRLLAAAGVEKAARSVTFESLTGYKRRFAIEEAREFLLAFSVAGAPLTPGHGFPARLVAPGYRGYDWVKWVARVEVQSSPASWQSPLPLQ